MIDLALLQEDLEIAHDRLKELIGEYNVVRSKKDKIKPTRLDDSFKAQLQVKDDNIDRINGLLTSKTAQLEHDSKNLSVAAAHILVLEGRISNNKKIAIEREKDLVAALTKISDQLEEIDELESDTNRGGVQLKSSSEEIDTLNQNVKSKDNNIERLNKRIIELEGQLEEVPEENETGGYKRRKFIE